MFWCATNISSILCLIWIYFLPASTLLTWFSTNNDFFTRFGSPFFSNIYICSYNYDNTVWSTGRLKAFLNLYFLRSFSSDIYLILLINSYIPSLSFNCPSLVVWNQLTLRWKDKIISPHSAMWVVFKPSRVPAFVHSFIQMSTYMHPNLEPPWIQPQPSRCFSM